MSEVISITLVAGFIIFGLGVVSAREHRRQRESKAQTELIARDATLAKSEKANSITPNAAMKMAAGGIKNEEASFETVGNHSR